MNNDGDVVRRQQLQARRQELAKQRENERKRSERGPDLAAAIGKALGVPLTLNDFDLKSKLPMSFSSTQDYRETKGLKLPYVSERRARHVVRCCDSTIGPQRGIIGFDEYSFLGVIHTDPVTLDSILSVAKMLHSEVLFCPTEIVGLIMFDHYRDYAIDREVDYTIVVQGPALESKLARCFANVVDISTAPDPRKEI